MRRDDLSTLLPTALPPPAPPAWPPTPVVMSHVRADQPAVVPYADPNEKANSDPDFAGMHAVRWITAREL